jgi:hypothetical protein
MNPIKGQRYLWTNNVLTEVIEVFEKYKYNARCKILTSSELGKIRNDRIGVMAYYFGGAGDNTIYKLLKNQDAPKEI